MNTESHIILPDGRKLAYAEYGKQDGYPVMYFHGTPSSRLEPAVIGEDVWSRLGLRVIAPDRPGMGDSDFQPKRGFSDWPKDVVVLADTLGLEQFAVLGNSGGGGYAMVCAAKIPERLSAVVIVSGSCGRMDSPEALNNLPVPNRLFWILTRYAPFMMPLLLKAMSGSSPDQMKKGLHPADLAVVEQPGRVEAFLQMIQAAIHQGTKGPLWDMRLYVGKFDFQLDEVQMPLKLFHSEQDGNVPIALVRRVVAELPSAELIIYENEAHLSTFANHVNQIAQALVAPVAINANSPPHSS